MILTIDVGNSNIVSVIYDETGVPIFQKREETLRDVSNLEYQELFKNLQNEAEAIDIKSVVLSCVVPSVEEYIIEAINVIFQIEVLSIQASEVSQLKIMLDDPNELGADFVATTLGAFKKYEKPIIIVDMGSATKISVVDSDMNFLGGVISPGIGIMANGLHQKIPHLPPIKIEKPEVILGRNTIECIQSGIINGAIASVTQMSKDIEKEINMSCTKVITGGYSNLFKDTTEFIVDSLLLNDGLYHFYLLKEGK